MPVTTAAIGTAISAAIAAGKLGYGAAQTAKANKAAKNNPRPTKAIDQNIIDNQRIAQGNVGGLSEAAREFYKNQSMRGLQSGIDASLQGGASPNAISSIYDKFNNGLSEISTLDSKLYTESIDRLIKANIGVSEMNDTNWAINKYQPFADKAAAATSMKTAGINNMFGGASEMANVGADYAMQQMYMDTAKKYLSGGKPNTSSTVANNATGDAVNTTATNIIKASAKGNNTPMGTTGSLQLQQPSAVDYTSYFKPPPPSYNQFFQPEYPFVNQ